MPSSIKSQPFPRSLLFSTIRSRRHLEDERQLLTKESGEEGVVAGPAVPRSKKPKTDGGDDAVETSAKFHHDQYKSKLQIGFYCHNTSSKLMQLINKRFVSLGSNELKFLHDQDHPNSYYIVSNDNPHEMCLGLGCDIIVRAEMLQKDKMVKLTASDRSKKNREVKTIDIEDPTQLDNFLLNMHTICINDSRSRFLRDPMKNKHNAFRQNIFSRNFFQLQPFKAAFNADVIIVGGAGPEASLKMFEKLNLEPAGTVVHISYSQTPGKLHSLTNEKLSEGHFNHYYQNLVSIIETIFSKGRIVVPCNTAHASLDNWFTAQNISIVDYRKVLTDHLDNYDSAIGILGTSATTHLHKIYQQYSDKAHKQTRFITTRTPSAIDRAIFLIKTGAQSNRSEAKDIIMKAISEIRGVEGEHLPVALCCTELPTVFTKDEISNQGLICPSSLVADYITKESVKAKIPEKLIGGHKFSILDSKTAQRKK